MPAPESLPNGGQLGEYVLLDKLGQGGMGAVYKAQHRRLKRLAAVKVLAGPALNNPQAVARFQQEMEALARLDHPNLIRALDAGEADGVHFLVMEFLEGEDLGRVLEPRGRLPAAEACRIIAQAAQGLQHAHENGLVHRDVKPSNLFLAKRADKPGRVVKVLDLGLALLRDTAASDRLTATQQSLGTPDYMSPEQFDSSRTVDGRSDVYSLGCTLYHLLAGEPPFAGGSNVQKMASHLFHPPRPLAETRPDVPRDVAAVVAKMMAKNPDDRYATPAEAARALAPFTRRAESGPAVDPVPTDAATRPTDFPAVTTPIPVPGGRLPAATPVRPTPATVPPDPLPPADATSPPPGPAVPRRDGWRGGVVGAVASGVCCTAAVLATKSSVDTWAIMAVVVVVFGGFFAALGFLAGWLTRDRWAWATVAGFAGLGALIGVARHESIRLTAFLTTGLFFGLWFGWAVAGAVSFLLFLRRLARRAFGGPVRTVTPRSP